MNQERILAELKEYIMVEEGQSEGYVKQIYGFKVKWKEYRMKLREYEESTSIQDLLKVYESQEPLLSSPFQFFNSYLMLNGEQKVEVMQNKLINYYKNEA